MVSSCCRTNNREERLGGEEQGWGGAGETAASTLPPPHRQCCQGPWSVGREPALERSGGILAPGKSSALAQKDPPSARPGPCTSLLSSKPRSVQWGLLRDQGAWHCSLGDSQRACLLPPIPTRQLRRCLLGGGGSAPPLLQGPLTLAAERSCPGSP